MSPIADEPAPAAATLRDARPEDRGAVIALFRGLQAFEREFEANRAPPGETDAHVDALLAWAAKGGCALLAEIDGRPVGLLIAGLTDDGPYVLPENRPHAQVTDLFVAPEARRRGLASAQIAEAERRFRAAGIRRMEIGVLAPNAGARALYAAWSGGGPVHMTYAEAL